MALEKNTSRRKSGGLKTAIIALVILLWLAGTGFLAYKFMEYRKQNQALRSDLSKTNQQLETIRTNPQQAAEAEVKRYVDEVGKLYDLPKEEQPSVATVSDKEKLKDQPFFAKAENGDVTLIYTNAKLAILYRPSSKQIINVSAVTIQDDKKP